MLTGTKALAPHRWKPSTGWLFLCFLSLASLGADAPEPTGTVTGTLIDFDGNPVVGARVQTSVDDQTGISEPKPVETLSDAKGRFRLGPLPAAFWNQSTTIIEADGFARYSIQRGSYPIFPRGDSDLGPIRLDRGRVFLGQVLDYNGKPVANAAVTVNSFVHIRGHGSYNDGPEANLITDADGQFRTPPLAVGTLSLHVRAPDRESSFVTRPILAVGEGKLDPIQLAMDVSITGTVIDDDGNPVSGAQLDGSNYISAVTDSKGRFSLRGFGAKPSFQLNLRKLGYLPANGFLRSNDSGIRFSETVQSRSRFGLTVPKNTTPAPFEKTLTISLTRAGWFEGRAIDAETGEPVDLQRVVVCSFERKPSGEVVLNGCRSGYESTGPGLFRAPFYLPEEYHLTLSAAGYQDAEVFTPKAAALATIAGLVAKMKKKADGKPQVAHQAFSGTVLRDGRLIASGCVGLWALKKTSDAPNAPIMRGRTAAAPPILCASATISNGEFSLDVPYQGDSWYIAVAEPGHAVTEVGPLAIAFEEKKPITINCVDGGQISGHVKGIPDGWKGHGWVVAFNKTGVRAECRIEQSGDFTLPLLPAGEFGLKVGHDAYVEAEVYPGNEMRKHHREAFKAIADPWKKATLVKLDAGRNVGGVELEWPGDGPKVDYSE